MSYRPNIGSLTAAQVAETDQVLTDLWTRIGRQQSIVADARQAGFDRDLVNELTRQGNELMQRIETLSVQADGISDAQYDEWRNRLRSFGTEVGLFEQSVRTQIGTGSAARNWKIIGSTAGALAVAGLIGAVIWYTSFHGDV